MKAGSLFILLIGVTIVSVILCINLFNMGAAKAQSGNVSSNPDISNITYQSTNTGQNTNFQQAANISSHSKRAEASLGPPKPIDQEKVAHSFFSEQFLKLAKDQIKRSESAANFGKTVSVDPRSIPGLNINQSNKSILNATNLNAPTLNATNLNAPTLNATNLNTSIVGGHQTTILVNKSINGWRGLNIRTANLAERPTPPDVAMAVGPRHIVEIAHKAVEIWDKNGKSLGISSLDNFFKTNRGHFIGDQDILYDNQSGRWFATIFDIGLTNILGEPICKPNGCSVLAAVSANDDPTGNWTIYRFPFGNVIPDYPRFAVSNDKFIFSINVGPIGSKHIVGSRTVVADKNSMISGQNKNISYALSGLNRELFTVLPVISSSSLKCPFMLSTDVRNNGISTSVNLFSVCGNPSTNNVKINYLKNIRMSPAPLPVQAGQSIAKKIDTGDFRMLTAVLYNNTIWNAFSTSCSPAGGTEVQACLRIQRINATDYSLLDDTNVGIRGINLFNPSLATSKNGDMSFIAAASSSSLPLTLLVGDKNYNLEVLKNGTGPVNDDPTDDSPNRFGDYLSASTDPADGSLWLSGEYIDTSPPHEWSTYIGHVAK